MPEKSNAGSDGLAGFTAALAADDTLRDQVQRARSAQAVIDLAAEHGYTLTADDLPSAPVDGVLSDADLDSVAGGWISLITCNLCLTLTYGQCIDDLKKG